METLKIKLEKIEQKMNQGEERGPRWRERERERGEGVAGKNKKNTEKLKKQGNREEKKHSNKGNRS